MTTSAAETARLSHNPRLVEPLMGEIATLLDRCLSYREEAANLEINGIAAALGRMVANGVRDIDRKMIVADASPEVAALLAANFVTAADQFRRDGTPLGKGTAIEIAAQGAGNDKTSASEAERRSLAASRLSFTQKIQNQLQARYDVPGNAHNYAERHVRKRALFLSDIQAAYERAMAVAVGAKDLFGFNEPLPVPTPNVLDALVLWSKLAMRAATRVAETEIEFTKDIAVTVPTGSAPIALDTTNAFAGLLNLRLRAVGASWISASGELKDNIETQYFTTQLVCARTDGQLGPKSVFIIGGVRAFGLQRPVEMNSGAAIYNLDPRGQWTIRLAPMGHTQNPTLDWPRNSLIKALVLHFQVLAVPDPTKDSAWWTTADRL